MPESNGDGAGERINLTTIYKEGAAFERARVKRDLLEICENIEQAIEDAKIAAQKFTPLYNKFYRKPKRGFLTLVHTEGEKTQIFAGLKSVCDELKTIFDSAVAQIQKGNARLETITKTKAGLLDKEKSDGNPIRILHTDNANGCLRQFQYLVSTMIADNLNEVARHDLAPMQDVAKLAKEALRPNEISAYRIYLNVIYNQFQKMAQWCKDWEATLS